MHIEIKGVHMEVTDKVREHFDRQLQKIDFAKDMIIDLPFTFTKEKSNYAFEATIHFRWGSTAHISVSSFDVYEGINSLIDKIENKVTREKEKIQEHNV